MHKISPIIVHLGRNRVGRIATSFLNCCTQLFRCDLKPSNMVYRRVYDQPIAVGVVGGCSGSTSTEDYTSDTGTYVSYCLKSSGVILRATA